MKKHFRTLTATALLTVTLGSTAAFARRDSKTYHGSFCQPIVASRQVAYDENGVLNFDSNGFGTTVVCPIIMDEARLGIKGGMVAVVDRATNGRVSCVVRSTNSPDGAPRTTLVTQSVSTSDAFADENAKHLRFGSLPNPGASGHYSMSCLLHPAANIFFAPGVVFYQIVEGN